MLRPGHCLAWPAARAVPAAGEASSRPGQARHLACSTLPAEPFSNPTCALHASAAYGWRGGLLQHVHVSAVGGPALHGVSLHSTQRRRRHIRMLPCMHARSSTQLAAAQLPASLPPLLSSRLACRGSVPANPGHGETEWATEWNQVRACAGLVRNKNLQARVTSCLVHRVSFLSPSKCGRTSLRTTRTPTLISPPFTSGPTCGSARAARRRCPSRSWNSTSGSTCRVRLSIACACLVPNPLLPASLPVTMPPAQMPSH